MAPLFKVFFDDPIPFASSSSSSSSSRKITASSLKAATLGKENVNPRSAAMKMSSTSSLKSKKVIGELDRYPRKAITTMENRNGICTGTLTTRILPALPPLPPSTMIHLRPAAAATAIKRSVRRNAGESVAATTTAKLKSTPPSLQHLPAVARSVAYSNVLDSGYARLEMAEETKDEVERDLIEQEMRREMLSEGSQDEAMSREAEGECTIVMDHDDDDEDDLMRTQQRNAMDTNRLARGLTESPLAEITQAFTSLLGDAFQHSPSTFSSAMPSSLRHHRSASSPTRSPKSISMRRVISQPYWPAAAPTGTLRKSKVALRVKGDEVAAIPRGPLRL